MLNPKHKEGIMNPSEVNVEKLISDLKAVIRDAEGLLKATAGEVSETARVAREKLATGLESAHATCRELEDKAFERARAADLVVRDHPYESMGIAFGIGLVIGVLLSRR